MLIGLACLCSFSIFQYFVQRHEHSILLEENLHRGKDKLRGCDCGESVGEAIARGCEFDGLASKFCGKRI